MPKFDSMGTVSEVLSVPVGDLIASVGESIADAQRALDEQAIEAFRELHTSDRETLRSLRSVGYQPTWYQIPEATAEISIALSAAGSTSTTASTSGRRSRVQVRAAPVDATYQSRFNYGVQASSSLKFRVVPIPPPVGAEGLRVVPEVVGMSVDETMAVLDELGIEYEMSAETGVVTGQEPGPGGLLEVGRVLQVEVDEAGR